jgi:hypothetical protein
MASTTDSPAASSTVELISDCPFHLADLAKRLDLERSLSKICSSFSKHFRNAGYKASQTQTNGITKKD